MTLSVRKNIIILVALSGFILNLVYGVELLIEFFNPLHSTQIKEFLISGIVLEFAWSLLFIWVIYKPIERRAILLISIIPILSGNILHNINLIFLEESIIVSLVSNFIFGLLYSGLYFFAYVVGAEYIDKC